MPPDVTRAPLATYRVQLTRDFGFAPAADLAPYLARLGVSHFYASPYLQARPGSTHGYDVVDPEKVNGELGGAEGHALLCRALAREGLGQILDIVPNHMAVAGHRNLKWQDVMANGPMSLYASYFDIDWAAGGGKLMVPILGDHLGRVLEAGQIRLIWDASGLAAVYFEHRFPLAPESLPLVLAPAARRATSDLLAFLARAFASLSRSLEETDREDRDRDRRVLEGLLNRLGEEDERVSAAVEEVLAEISRDPDRLAGLLACQHYRLAYWRLARYDINYRRFFNINDLAGIRIEDPSVFRETHRLVLDWLDRGLLDGVRIDHPDGLRDPEGYLGRLRQAAPAAWITVEKILEPGERLPASWPVAGTTGYDFLNQVGGLFVDPAGEAAFTRLYQEFTGRTGPFEAVVREKKRFMLADSFNGEVGQLTDLLVRTAAGQRNYADVSRREMDAALREIIASFPVYRTYIRPQDGRLREEDRETVARAVDRARDSLPGLDPRLWEFIREVFALRFPGAEAADFILRFQQLTGPAMAKGVEDTALYVYNRLIALNEVGGDPARFGVSPDAFHPYCRWVQENAPQTMLATATHDTKRGEDTRLRISLLSEIPKRWGEAVERWHRMNRRFLTEGRPGRNTEYFLYQTLAGTWPISLERLQAYMQKAVREAKEHTSWTGVDSEYEAALAGFIDSIAQSDEFVRDLEAFLAPLIPPARTASLAQALIKLTAPGIPDLYQGTELWDHSLVDPDNRRPVDYDRRRRLLAELSDLSPAAILERAGEGLPKLFVIRRALEVRRRLPEAFGPAGTYAPLQLSGARQDHGLAYVRGGSVATVVPRLLLRLGGDWEGTALLLPEGRWEERFSGREFGGGRVKMADLLETFPVALLIRR